MTEEPERFDLRSHNIARGKREELLRLFPDRTEDGQIDFDRLKLTLGEAVDVGEERHGMTWPGTAECFKVISCLRYTTTGLARLRAQTARALAQGLR